MRQPGSEESLEWHFGITGASPGVRINEIVGYAIVKGVDSFILHKLTEDNPKGVRLKILENLSREQKLELLKGYKKDMGVKASEDFLKSENRLDALLILLLDMTKQARDMTTKLFTNHLLYGDFDGKQ